MDEVESKLYDKIIKDDLDFSSLPNIDPQAKDFIEKLLHKDYK